MAVNILLIYSKSIMFTAIKIFGLIIANNPQK